MQDQTLDPELGSFFAGLHARKACLLSMQTLATHAAFCLRAAPDEEACGTPAWAVCLQAHVFTGAHMKELLQPQPDLGP